MSAVVITKGEDGKLTGFGEKGGRAWAKFLKRVQSLAAGDTLQFQWHEPRSPQHHKFFFAKLGRLADMQEQFEDADKLRVWVTVGAGYCDFMPGPKGRMVAFPQSIAWHKMDEADFADLHNKVDAFLWTPQARAFLWPHLTEQETYQMIEQVCA